MIMVRSGICVLLYYFFAQTCIGQEVSVSEDINLRGDYAYELLKPIGDNILLYRDRGLRQEVIAYDKDLQFKWERDLTLDKKKVSIIGLVDRHDYFNVFYSYRDRRGEVLKVDQFNSDTDQIDSTSIHFEEGYKNGEYQWEESEDGSKTLIYSVDNKEKISIFVMDNDSLDILWKANVEFSEINLYRDTPQLIISNRGEIFLMLDKYNNKYKKDKHLIEILRLADGPIESVLVPMKNKISQGVLFTYDNVNEKITLAGLYGDDKQNVSSGYFRLSKNFEDMDGTESVTFSIFSDAFINKVYSKESKKKRGLEHFKAVDVILRNDGGLLLVTEMQKKFSRRNPISTASSNQYSLRGWNDYFNEDVILIAIHPDGKEHWKEILYKKQFSQDDNNIYASIFAFTTPSRLKVIFNDQIKVDNTVSEYVVDGLGNSKRESLFSTEHQDLKLRIKDAIQISPTELLIPSERNSNLNIVKITYL